VFHTEHKYIVDLTKKKLGQSQPPAKRYSRFCVGTGKDKKVHIEKLKKLKNGNNKR